MTAADEAEVFSRIGFLNEVMSRYPEAISFAPGAPLLAGMTRERMIAALDAGARLAEAGAAWEKLFPYGPSQGLINDALARALNAGPGLAVQGADLVVTVGAQEAFLLVLRGLGLHAGGAAAGPLGDFAGSPTGGSLGIVTPAFAGIRGAAAFLGVRSVEIPEGPSGLTPAALEHACRTVAGAGGPLRAVYLAPDYSNPSGIVLDRETRLGLLTVAREHGVLLIEDTTYGFTDPDVPPSLKALDEHRSVIQIGTFSKVCFPGARVGYVVADQPWHEGNLAAWLATLKNMTTVNTSPLSQAAVAGLVLGEAAGLHERGKELAQLYREKREALLAALDEEFTDAGQLGVSWNRPTGGFFIVLETRHDMDHAALERCAVRHGVLWTPMRDFYASGEGDRQLRLSHSFVPTEQIREGVRRLAAFLRDESARARV